MKMTARRQRLAWVGVLLIAVAVAVALGSMAFRENLMYFHTPSDIAGRVEIHKVLAKSHRAQRHRHRHRDQQHANPCQPLSTRRHLHPRSP